MYLLIITLLCQACLGVPSHLGVAACLVLFLTLSLRPDYLCTLGGVGAPY